MYATMLNTYYTMAAHAKIEVHWNTQTSRRGQQVTLTHKKVGSPFKKVQNSIQNTMLQKKNAQCMLNPDNLIQIDFVFGISLVKTASSTFSWPSLSVGLTLCLENNKAKKTFLNSKYFLHEICIKFKWLIHCDMYLTFNKRIFVKNKLTYKSWSLVDIAPGSYLPLMKRIPYPADCYIL